MKRKKILIVSVSSKEYLEDTLIGNSAVCKSIVDKSNLINSKNIYFKFTPKNTKSLASIYNEYISEKYKDYIVVFIHDDVYISDADFAEKCYEAITNFDIFGVAGGAGGFEITPPAPALWHLISKRKVGFAGHFEDKEDLNTIRPFSNVCWVTNFGTSPSKATLIDGVLMGINVEKVLDKNIKFDEECPSRFHFYDLIFCVKAKLKGLSLGVFPFNIFHASHGLTEPNAEFYSGDLYFKELCAKIK
jgi:hypothetical protein